MEEDLLTNLKIPETIVPQPQVKSNNSRHSVKSNVDIWEKNLQLEREN